MGNVLQMPETGNGFQLADGVDAARAFTKAQRAALFALASQTGPTGIVKMTMAEIARRAGYAEHAMSVAVNRLLASGFLARDPDCAWKYRWDLAQTKRFALEVRAEDERHGATAHHKPNSR